VGLAGLFCSTKIPPVSAFDILPATTTILPYVRVFDLRMLDMTK